MKKIYYATLFLLCTLHISAQENIYLEEVFSDISVTQNQVYGVNATIVAFPLPGVGQAIPQPLVFDLYQPTENTATLRPLIIYFHTGNFLPYPQNNSVNGTIRDSTVVTMAKRLASAGYVVASADYRLGWTPTAPSKDERVFTLINAAYRGVQDANTAIRYFKKTVVEGGNPWKIDTSRIVLFGDGTGGYISMNTAALDDYNKIPSASNGKFLLADDQGNIIPMVLESVNGNIEGTSYGVIPAGGLPHLPFPENDTLNYPNHVGYSSDFAVAVNLGGAIGDTAWIDPGQPPVISVHVPYDPFAPYVEGIVVVPVTPPLEVVEVQGSYLNAYLKNQYGTNSMLTPTNVTSLQFEVTDVANSRNDELEGLFPIYGTGGPFDSAPWTFWDPATNVNSAAGFLQNPDMTKQKAVTYMDSILAYVLPRLYKAMDLAELVSTEEVLSADQINFITYPNPGTTEVFISTHKQYPIRDLHVYDLKGVLVGSLRDVNDNYARLNVRNLAPGQYLVQLRFDEGTAARQIIIK